MGLDAWRDHRGAKRAARKRPQDWARSLALSQSVASEPGRCPAALQDRSCAGAQYGPAALGAARQISGGCHRPQQDSGTAVQTGGSRAKDRRDSWREIPMSTATLPPITPLTKKDFQTDQ